MASLMKTTSTVAGRLILRQGALQAMLASTNGAASQAKLAASGDDVQQSDETTAQVSDVETNDIFMHKTRDQLKVSLENVISNGVQGELIEKLAPYFKTTINEEKLPNVTFNHVAEEVYLKHLYMTFRKLGYQCMFTRYNGDKGMAYFQREDPDETKVAYSYFKSDKPNIC